MGFEDFAVRLYPSEQSSLRAGNNLPSLHRLISEVRDSWPMLHPDTIEEERFFPAKPDEMTILVWESSQGLFQVYFLLGNVHDDDILISACLAYTNPRSVYDPFCSFVESTMQRCKLFCHVVPPLPPDLPSNYTTITDPQYVRSVLVPCIDYNRRLWQLDASTDEEAILRPGDAVARFITPQLEPYIADAS